MSAFDYTGAAGDAYHAERHAEFLEAPLLLEAMSHFARRSYFPELKSGQRVLEVGAGLGKNLFAIQNIATVTAIEPAPAAREAMAKRGLTVLSALTDLPAGANFDVVLLSHVLEHLSDPRAMLLDLRALIAPGGHLVIAIPCEHPHATPLAHDLDHHLYCWNRQTLGNLLADCGFRVRESRLNWRNGRKIFLPLYRLFGPNVFCAAMRTLGWIRRYAEIVAVAEPVPKK